MNEFEKLVKWLSKNDYNYILTDLCGGDQVIIYTEDGERFCDVICHKYSYGYEQGLLEMMGRPVNTEGCVKGYLTAKDCEDIILGKYNWSKLNLCENGNF